MRPFVTGLALVAAVLAGCSSPAASPSPTGTGLQGSAGSTPSTPASAAPNPSAALASARQCGPGDVAAGPVWWTGAGGAMGGGVTFTDTSASPCELDGWADLSILDAKGAVMPIEVRHATGYSPAPVVLLPGLGTPDPNGSPVPGRAGVQTIWMNWCGTQPFPPGTLVVMVPGVGRLTATISGLSVARCDTPGGPSTLEVSPIVSATP